MHMIRPYIYYTYIPILKYLFKNNKRTENKIRHSQNFDVTTPIKFVLTRNGLKSFNGSSLMLNSYLVVLAALLQRGQPNQPLPTAIPPPSGRQGRSGQAGRAGGCISRGSLCIHHITMAKIQRS